MSDVEDAIGLRREPSHHLVRREHRVSVTLCGLLELPTLPPVSLKCCRSRSMVLLVTIYPSVRWFSPGVLWRVLRFVAQLLAG